MSPDSFLARALLASGMLTRSKLDIALKWLEESPASGLGDILCTNGVILRTTYEALMRFYKKDNTRMTMTSGNRERGVQEAQLFCLIAMREEEITEDQMKDSVDQWVRLEGMGKPRPIGDVLIEKGYLDLARMRALLEKTKHSTLGCSACASVDALYKVNGSPFTCDACKAPLVPTTIREAAPAAPTDPLAGKMIAGCRLDEKVGQGRWTQVWKALMPAQNRNVAVKVFNEGTPKPALDRFLQNALKSTTFVHPGLVSIVTAGMEGASGYVVMEWVEGKAPPKRDKTPWNKLCKIAIDLARGLSVIHANGYQHGNVRPESILLRSEGGAKLGDFGQAHDSSLPTPGDPRFMAPELWRNDPGDSRSDLYALGATLYTLAAGRPPFEVEDPRQLELAHRSQVPKTPGTHNLELPRGVSHVIMKLLEKEPAARYGFAEEVARDFEAILRGEQPGSMGAESAAGPAITCVYCKSENPPGSKTCVLCGKVIKDKGDAILLDDEFLCPKCEKALNPEIVKCECGYRPCQKCHQREGDEEFGYCSTCLTPEAAAELRRKKSFRGPAKLHKPMMGPKTAALKPAPPATASLKPPPPAAAKPSTQPPQVAAEKAPSPELKPPPPAAGKPATQVFKAAPPPAGKPATQVFKAAPPPANPATRTLKSPPPPASAPSAPPAGKPAEDDLDFDNLPPPQKAAPAAAAPADDDLDFDNLPPPKK